MSLGTIRDIMILIIGIIIIWVQINQAISKKRKKIWIAILFFLVFLGTWQIIDNENQKSRIKKESKRQSELLLSLQKSKTADSIRTIKEKTAKGIQDAAKNIQDAEFQKKLFEQFKIIRDSTTNSPVKKIYNTNIEKARDVIFN